MSKQHLSHPCNQCPFRKDSTKGWLGADRMTEILDAPSFTCHKTKDPKLKQCAGHMLIKGEESQFAQFANRINFDLKLTGRELIFDDKIDCVNHHEN